MENRSYWKELLAGYIREDLDTGRRRGLLAAISRGDDEAEWKELMGELLEEMAFSADYDPKEWDPVVDRILSTPSATPVRRLPFRRWWWAAAVVSLLCGAGGILLLVNRQRPVVQTSQAVAPADIRPPANNRAIVTLANGNTVYLDSLANGLIAAQGSKQIVKLEDGKIAYQGGSGTVVTPGHGALVYNTLTNPRGSKVISVQLSDGTTVWLNAQSTLRYPVEFSGHDRPVEISGEAYFEVAHDRTKPFKVAMLAASGQRGAEVEVLGTHFNVNAYSDEPDMRVTLLEGSVRVALTDPRGKRQESRIKPGEQARITDRIAVSADIDIDEVMAWKNGKFQFAENTSIESIMRQISRWYDVDVEYEGKVTDHFWGSSARDANVSDLLKKLEATGSVHFRIDGKKVIVTP